MGLTTRWGNNLTSNQYIFHFHFHSAKRCHCSLHAMMSHTLRGYLVTLGSISPRDLWIQIWCSYIHAVKLSQYLLWCCCHSFGVTFKVFHCFTTQKSELKPEAKWEIAILTRTMLWFITPPILAMTIYCKDFAYPKQKLKLKKCNSLSPLQSFKAADLVFHHDFCLPQWNLHNWEAQRWLRLDQHKGCSTLVQHHQTVDVHFSSWRVNTGVDIQVFPIYRISDLLSP